MEARVNCQAEDVGVDDADTDDDVGIDNEDDPLDDEAAVIDNPSTVKLL